MKKTILSLVCIMAFAMAGAQDQNVPEIPGKRKPAFGNIKPFEVAVSAGFNSSSISFPKASLYTNGLTGFAGGLTVQYNYKSFFAFRTGAFFEMNRSHYPDQTNLFGSSLSYRQTDINVPLSLIFQCGNQDARFYLGFGPNARFSLDSELEALDYKTNKIQYGAHMLFGFKFSHFFMEETIGYQMNDLFHKDAAAPKSSLNTFSLRVGWMF